MIYSWDCTIHMMPWTSTGAWISWRYIALGRGTYICSSSTGAFRSWWPRRVATMDLHLSNIGGPSQQPSLFQFFQISDRCGFQELTNDSGVGDHGYKII